MSAEAQNISPRKPATVSTKVRRYLESPEIAEKIHKLYEETRISIKGPRSGKDESHLESLQDLAESARFDRSAHEEWITKLPKEKQQAYMEFMFLMKSLRGILSEYGAALREEGEFEEFDQSIIDEVFDNLSPQALEEEAIESVHIKTLAVYYAKVRRYLIQAKDSKSRYERETFHKHTDDVIKIFRLIKEDEKDPARQTTVEEGLQALQALQVEIGRGEATIGAEELEKLEKCYLHIPELRMVKPEGSTSIDRIYGEKMQPEALEMTKKRISHAVRVNDKDPMALQVKADNLQGDFVSRMFPINEEGDRLLTEVLSEDLLKYIPKDIPANIREEFRKELKELMIGMNRISMHLQKIRDINGFETSSNKNLQLTLLHGVRDELEQLRRLMIRQEHVKMVYELEPISDDDEIETITYEVIVKKSEVLRDNEEGEKAPTDVLRERKETARFGLSHAVREISKRIDALFEEMKDKDSSYHPGREIKHCCDTSINKLRRSAQLLAGVFNKDPRLTKMFPEVKQEIMEAVKFRSDVYAFYMNLLPIAERIQNLADNYPSSEENIEDSRHRNVAKFMRFQKRGEFAKSIAGFQEALEDNNDVISRMRPADRELVIDQQMALDQYLMASPEERPSMGDAARMVHTFMIPLKQIATHEVNKRELLRHEDRINVENAIEYLFMSNWVIRQKELSREALLRVITRLTEANNSLKAAFYRNPIVIVKVQKGLNEMSETLLSVLIASLEPMMTEDEQEQDRNRKINIDEETKKKVISFLGAAEERLDIAHTLL